MCPTLSLRIARSKEAPCLQVLHATTTRARDCRQHQDRLLLLCLYQALPVVRKASVLSNPHFHMLLIKPCKEKGKP
jgi:hypothetical protein